MKKTYLFLTLKYLIFFLLLFSLFFLGAIFHRFHFPPFNFISDFYNNYVNAQLTNEKIIKDMSEKMDKVVIDWEFEIIEEYIELKYSKGVEIEINKTEKTITIYKNSINQVALISSKDNESGITFSDWSIFFNTNIDVFNQTTQIFNLYDKNFLRGCLTLKNLKLENLKLYSENSNCEDSILLLNTQGTIEHIHIFNSYSDALDLDYSNLKIKEIIIENAKNDCIDFGEGNYIIDILYLYKCKNPVSLDYNSNATFNFLANFRENQWDKYDRKHFIKNPFKCLRQRKIIECYPK